MPEPGGFPVTLDLTAAALPDDPAAWPIVPRIDPQLKARLRVLFADGLASGNRADVFVKVGDSISESRSYLAGFGCNPGSLGAHTELGPIIEFYQRRSFLPEWTTSSCGVANSFDRDSLATVIGWTAERPLEPFSEPAPFPACDHAPYDTPFTCEMRMLRPSVALIMFGTNDLGHSTDPAAFETALTLLVQRALAVDTIPVLSTVPPYLADEGLGERVLDYNRAIIQVARSERVPLWNYWLALVQPNMDNAGISADGVHPSVSTDGTDFTDLGLREGFNQRNLTALQVLAKLKDVVFDDGTPDAEPSASILDFTVSPVELYAPPGSRVRWDLDPGNTLAHTVTDASGLDLFDSKAIPPGGSFSFTFLSAGAYRYRCSIHPTLMRGTVQVPVRVEPPEGGSLGTTFAITWAALPATVGYTYDVQILRPGGAWKNWLSGQTAPSADFMPDAGPGTYAFRARLRSTEPRAASKFSAPVEVVVG